jgi:type IV secretory pathway VirD2 relaxase
VTLELGHQSEIEVARKLANEVDAEWLTRLDKMLIAEQRGQGVIDLRPGEGSSYLLRENRHLMISRAKRLERYGLAAETEPGRWVVSGSGASELRIARLCVSVPRAVRSQLFSPETVGLRPLAAFQF